MLIFLFLPCPNLARQEWTGRTIQAFSRLLGTAVSGPPPGSLGGCGWLRVITVQSASERQGRVGGRMAHASRLGPRKGQGFGHLSGLGTLFAMKSPASSSVGPPKKVISHNLRLPATTRFNTCTEYTRRRYLLTLSSQHCPLPLQHCTALHSSIVVDRLHTQHSIPPKRARNKRAHHDHSTPTSSRIS